MNLVTLLDRLTELREMHYSVGHPFSVRGYNSETGHGKDAGTRDKEESGELPGLENSCRSGETGTAERTEARSPFPSIAPAWCFGFSWRFHDVVTIVYIIGHR